MTSLSRTPNLACVVRRAECGFMYVFDNNEQFVLYVYKMTFN